MCVCVFRIQAILEMELCWLQKEGVLGVGGRTWQKHELQNQYNGVVLVFTNIFPSLY